MDKFGLYTKKVIEHFKNPHNYGKMKNPDGIGKVGNIYCGDVMHLYIKIAKNKKNQEVIKDISFETFGCAAAISTSSVVTDLAKGKTIDSALKINNRDVVKKLGSLPSIKIHCSLLAVDALSEAVYDYLSKDKREIPKELLKRHERISKNRDEIEKRYAKWIK
ncbi:MAG: iron-sulfur cluster assembly scaffold protein [Candidatus Pacebacteria bacterium]|nr:iron-sulfur cluster assembly scaffold protein [Candidatus Paceibacterota bacterium]